jgi:hypothetical protein
LNRFLIFHSKPFISGGPFGRPPKRAVLNSGVF